MISNGWSAQACAGSRRFCRHPARHPALRRARLAARAPAKRIDQYQFIAWLCAHAPQGLP